MTCKKCKNEIPNNSTLCPECGYNLSNKKTVISIVLSVFLCITFSTCSFIVGLSLGNETVSPQQEENNIEIQTHIDSSSETISALEAEIEMEKEKSENLENSLADYNRIKEFAEYKVSGNVSKSLSVENDIIIMRSSDVAKNYKINYTGSTKTDTVLSVSTKGFSVKHNAVQGLTHDTSKLFTIQPTNPGVSVLTFKEDNDSDICLKLLIIVL